MINRWTARHERRLAPTLTVATLVVILIAIPRHYRLLPQYSEIVLGGALIAFLWTPFWRYALAIFAVVVGGIEITILAQLLYEMATNPSSLEAIPLLWTAIDLWLTNIVLFSLVYWQLDRGGPAGRAGAWQGRADFAFPRGAPDEGVPDDWKPSFVDYLYLAVTTNTAFSPSEIYPLTGRAKILHMIQSLISLLTIVAIAARAINVLGK
jgi:hypothetical protein